LYSSGQPWRTSRRSTRSSAATSTESWWTSSTSTRNS